MIEEYRSYFDNIIAVAWAHADPDASCTSDFDPNNIQEIIYMLKYANRSYIIGKTSHFYFLATHHQDNEYSYTKIHKHAFIAPLINHIKDFKSIYPTLTPKQFKTVLLEDRLQKSLSEKPVEKRVVKI